MLLFKALVLLIAASGSWIQLARTESDFYNILEISKDASEREIKQAYKRLALKYHPDKNEGDEAATKKFTEINNAYEVLSDKEKKKIYDIYGHEGLKQSGSSSGGGGGGMNFAHDLFRQFFGSDVSEEEEEKIAKGDDVIVEIHVSLEDLYMGSTLKIWREKNVLKPAPGKRQCNCRNEMFHKQIGPGMYQQFTQQVCEKCPNVKFEREGFYITLDIEKGMRDGHEVVFYEDGEPIIDGEPGDLKFRIFTQEHDKFERDGNDLFISVTISLVDALVGFKKQIPHLDGHTVEIGTSDITKPKQARVFKGEGMPIYQSLKKGDLHVTYEVSFPDKLTEQQKATIKTVFQQ